VVQHMKTDQAGVEVAVGCQTRILELRFRHSILLDGSIASAANLLSKRNVFVNRDLGKECSIYQ
jgi:hypothetical protein